MRRREFLTLSAMSIGGVLVYSLDREVFRLSAQPQQLHEFFPAMRWALLGEKQYGGEYAA